MKKTKFILFLSVLIILSCKSNEHYKLKIEVAEKPSINIDQYHEIVLTNFMIKEDPQDFDLNSELKDYQFSELARNLEKEVRVKDITIDNEGLFDSADFWKKVSSESTPAVILTGSVQYEKETRKALLKEKERSRFDNPFPSQSDLAERTFFTLHFDLYLIDSRSGQPIYSNNFK